MIFSGIRLVTIRKARKSQRKKCGLDKALDDVKAGRVHHADSVDDMFRQVLGK